MAPRETTVAASVVTDMLQYLADRGVPAAQAHFEARIKPASLASADARIPGSQVERLWRFAAEATDDPLVGLHMGADYNPGALDILGYVILSCGTVGELLEKFVRFASILNDGLRIELVREKSVAYLRCHFVEDADNYLLRTPAQAIDTIWSGVARELARLPVMPVTAVEVWFCHTVAAHQIAEYRRVIGAPVKFNVEDDRFILQLSDLEQPLRSANAALLEVFERHADTALRELQQHDTRAHQVARVVATRLKGSAPTLDDVARQMAMSTRSLQRVLRESGTSYQILLDEVRRDVAIQHLAHSTSSVGQIGYLIGFSEPSAFHRAFRRWTGKPPSAYR